MPEVRLTPEEVEGDLPAVCMCCGDRATHWVSRSFFLREPIVHGPSGFREVYALRLLIATAQTPRKRLRTSFCPRHRHYWMLRAILLWGGLAGFLTLMLLGLAVIVFVLAVLKRDAPVLFGIVMVPSLVCLIAWLIAVIVVQSRSIRAAFAPDGTEEVVLHNVGAGYAEALERQRTASQPARRGTAGSAIPVALSAAIAAGPRPVRKDASPEFPEDGERPASSRKEAAAYQSVADQLAKGATPAAVETHLIASGWDAETARLLVARVLEEMPGFLRSRYSWQLYLSLGLCGFCLFLLLGLSVPVFSASFTARNVLARFWVVLLLALIGQGYWLALGFFRIRLAQRLESDRATWLQTSGIRLGLAASRTSETSPPASMPSATARSLPPDRSSALARRAIEAHDGQRVRRSGLLFGGSVAALLAFGCCVFLPVALTLSRSHPSEDASPPPPEQAVGPNDPDPHEGPPPHGWTVLFRSDDPSLWNTDSPGKNFALPVRRAHSKIRYLRLTRLDNGAMLIVPITHKQLAREERPNPARGYWWNGTAAVEWNARHLGIVQVPPPPRRERGIIGVAGDGFNALTGSGFGGKCLVDDGTSCCWRGEEIPKTSFEIAVTTGPLTAEEENCLAK